MSSLDLAVAYKLSIVNSYFKKREEYLVTFKGGNTKMQMDYFLVRVNNRWWCRDYKVIPTECLMTQHRLLVLHVKVRSLKRKRRSVGNVRSKWWNLIGETATKLCKRIKIEGN